MAQGVYGVWNGVAFDRRRKFGENSLPVLSGLDEIAPGTATKAFISDRGFVVLDESTCLTEAFAQYLTQAASESCGRCLPCRVGTQRLRDLLKAVSAGDAYADALDEAKILAWQVTQTSLCAWARIAHGRCMRR